MRRLHPTALAVLMSTPLLACNGAPAARGSQGKTKASPRDANGDTKGDAKTPAADAVHASTKTPSGPHARARAELDQSVWKPEVDAQRHEEAFIDLWDRMRASDKPHEVLASFPFGQLKLGVIGAAETLENDLTRERTSGDGLTLDPAGWRAFIDAQHAQGWRLIQSEWHHSRFTPGEGSTPARSEVSFVLHAQNAPRGGIHRVAIEGTLKVEWGASPGASGRFEPTLIDAREVTLTRRSGQPAFAGPQVLDPFPAKAREKRAQPLLVYDLDGDGLSELVLVGANTIYRNKGSMQFEREVLLDDKARVGMTSPAMASALIDVDGDGVVDLVNATAGGGVFINRGDKGGRFTTGAAVAGALSEPLYAPVAITAGDIDGDGDLDLWVAQYKRPYVRGQMPTPYFDANDGFPSFLLVNDGKGTFTDGTEAAGLGAKRNRRTWSASFYDIDDDRDQDLIVISDFSGIDVYRNDGTGKFTDVTAEVIDERASFGMSHTIGDYDLDGHLDLYVVGMSSTTARRLERLGLGRDGYDDHEKMRMKMAYGNRLYNGRPDHTWKHSEFADQVARTGWSWGSTSFDFDNDGDSDIYVGNGHISRKSAKDYCTTYWTHDIYTGTSELDPELNKFFNEEFQDAIFEGVSWNGFEHNKLLVTRPGKGFVEAGFPMHVAREDDTRSVVSDDLDADGRPDLIIIATKARAGKVRGESSDERVMVMKNTWASDNHWIGVRLGGKRSPVGARVTVEYPGGTQQHRVVLGDSLQSQHPSGKHFGLGTHEAVTAITVEWTDGKKATLKNPAIDRYHVIK